MLRISELFRKARTTVGGAALAAVLAVPTVSLAQSVTVYGSPANFDALNDTGKDAHGFEVELQGVPPGTDIQLWPWSVYPGQVIPLANGVLLRWASPYSNGQYATTTVIPAVFQPTFGHSCVQGAVPGCEHFGYYSAFNVQAQTTVMRWLIDDPANPGNLIPSAGGLVNIPVPKASVIPGAVPVVDVQIEAPRPKEFQFGEAQWVKVLKSDSQKPVVVDQLLEDNAVVPNNGNAGQVETAWKLLQFNPHSANSGVLHSQSKIGVGVKAIVRKYEFYKYTGKYDPVDHGAICGGDGLCNEPQPGELGDYIGTQMEAANVGIPTLTVVKAGNGSGSVGGGGINCGSSCSVQQALANVVTLTAKPDSKSTFAGWTGDCVGTSLSCTFAITGENTVTANFAPVVVTGGGGGGGSTTTYKISISKNGKGTVTANPSAAAYAPGTVVTLTAVPDPGQPWVGWGGACSGTATTCTVTMTANLSVTANFR